MTAGRRLYDLIYRVGAPWEQGPRHELVDLVQRRVLDPAALPRAVDLGCGAGANAVFLASAGFQVTGVDFSAVALRQAHRLAAERGVAGRVRLVAGDLTSSQLLPGERFDLLVDYGTLDDLQGARREAMARTIARLARPTARFLLWCFCARRAQLPAISFRGPSRLSPGLEPGEAQRLFGGSFAIEELAAGGHRPGTACFLMTAGSELDASLRPAAPGDRVAP